MVILCYNKVKPQFNYLKENDHSYFTNSFNIFEYSKNKVHKAFSSNFWWQNRKERPNRSTNKAKRDVVSE